MHVSNLIATLLLGQSIVAQAKLSGDFAKPETAASENPGATQKRNLQQDDGLEPQGIYGTSHLLGTCQGKYVFGFHGYRLN